MGDPYRNIIDVIYMKSPLILASASPRRAQLLTMAEIPFEVQIPDTDESWPDTLVIDQIPVHIAEQKARFILNQHQDRDILAADTIVVIKDQIIGKPKDRQDAIHMLQVLSGATHRVITGVYLKLSDSVYQFSDCTEVSFHPLTLEQIVHYIDNYKPFDKAGSYAIQEWIGAVAIRSIRGCFYNVMGLPISRVNQLYQNG